MAMPIQLSCVSEGRCEGSRSNLTSHTISNDAGHSVTSANTGHSENNNHSKAIEYCPLCSEQRVASVMSLQHIKTHLLRSLGKIFDIATPP